MTVVHYRSRILLGGAIALSLLLTAFVIMGAVLPDSRHAGATKVKHSALELHQDTALPLQRAVRNARRYGVDSTFLARLIATPATMYHPRVLKLNVTNFAQKPDYSFNHNKASVRKVRVFMREHDSLLSTAAKAYDVPAEVIASILWVETKWGTVMGSTHVPSVYLSLMLSTDSAMVEQYIESVMTQRSLDSSKRDSVRTVVQARALKKTQWAAEQLKALDSIQRDGTLDIMSLRGSWAGAFGLSQFLPSSYRRWAVDGNNDKEINLDHLSDAVHSVANYLATNGWGPTIKQRRAAVHHYNNSQAYVDAVFTLAGKVVN